MFIFIYKLYCIRKPLLVNGLPAKLEGEYS